MEKVRFFTLRFLLIKSECYKGVLGLGIFIKLYTYDLCTFLWVCVCSVKNKGEGLPWWHSG